MSKLIQSISIILLLALSGFSATTRAVYSQDETTDWEKNWSVEKDFSIHLDSQGFHLPTAIAFVPNPGPNPKDALYFVAELRGILKIVTNDRSVYTFARDFFDLQPKEELPSGYGQVGLAGLCLDPRHGYVFATYAYQDQHQVLRNNITRFETKPEVFSLSPVSQVNFDRVFSVGESGLAHQIGACQVDGDFLYVSIGDGGRPTLSQDINYLNGKILRMTLDGEPDAENPFYQADGGTNVADYIWAYGLRNPFGLKAVDGRLFSVENGLAIDRFMRIERGENYIWDGTDESIQANAQIVFTPGVVPVHLDYYPHGSTLFPEKQRTAFFVALAGYPGKGKIPGILTFNYDVERNRVTSSPKFFLKYRGEEYQNVIGVAFGADGLYFSAIFPPENGAIYRITYDPDNPHLYTIGQSMDGDALMRAYGCVGCHSTANSKGFAGNATAGPDLDTEPLVARLKERLHSSAYIKSLQEIDRLNTEPFNSYRSARHEVLAAQGMDRVKIWMKYHIMEPRFDNRNALMPNLGVTEEDANIITAYLLEGTMQKSLIYRAVNRLRQDKAIPIAWLAGLLVGLLPVGAYNLIRLKNRRGNGLQVEK